MDKERLFNILDRRYSSKRDMVTRIPLGLQPDTLWRELLDRRRSRSTTQPLYGTNGIPYWYVTTDRMVAASEKVIEEMYENDTDFDPYMGVPSVSTLEEVFFTGYVEGVQISMQAAMEFITSGQPPRDIEEQLITNNRQAGNYAGGNLYRPIDIEFMRELAYILTDGMDNGGQEFRAEDEADYISHDGETFKFPPARVIQERLGDLCSFLAMPDVHPLIKAAAAQAYILILRPFPEGNERLSRIISVMILLRAGYAFFVDISLSALIAKRSYAYYEATANILREENGGDLTYFMEYFLELLSRAVDERRLRIQQNEERGRQAERDLARSALAPAADPPAQTEVFTDEAPLRAAEEGGDTENGFFTAEPGEEPDMNESAISLARVRDLLCKYADGKGKMIKRVAAVLLENMDNGVYSFTSNELEPKCGITARQIIKIIIYLRSNGVVVKTNDKIGQYAVYHLSTDLPPLGIPDYAPEIIETVKEMRNYDEYTVDRRIGEVMSRCIPKGIITAKDYELIGESDRMTDDMKIAIQMGLVKKIRRGVYRICREITNSDPVLTGNQKTMLTAMYKAFHKDPFTRKDAMELFNISKSSTNNMLRQFTRLQIIECRSGWTNTYILRADPIEQPMLFNGYELSGNDILTAQYTGKAGGPISGCKNEYSKEVYDLLDGLIGSEVSQADRRAGESIQRCLSKGIIVREDYERWGYTVNMWNYDIALAKQLGLVRMQCKGKYAINRELTPVTSELTPTQKKTITEIYETFGDRKFSSEMYIATLNYSPSRIYASLHKLTLMKVLDHKDTDEGIRYQLLVNPEENPEYFDIAA